MASLNRKILSTILRFIAKPVNDRINITALEEIIGYQFKNHELITRALTHRSMLPEKGTDYSQTYEQMEFLGDAVLDFIVVEYLCRKFPTKQEGELSKLKSMVVSGSALYQIAQKLNLGEFIQMSDNEERNGGRQRRSILEDVFESIVAALYLDGGLNAVYPFIQKQIFPIIDKYARSHADFNYKSQLLEYLQARGMANPQYRVVEEQGPDHAKQFQVEVVVDGRLLGIGIGSSKKSAQQKAAHVALKELIA